MDFILSLTHFCEVHGPTSILCSQLMPLNCPQCAEESADILFTPASPFLSHAECSPDSRSVRRTPRDRDRDRDDRPLSARSLRTPATSSGIELSSSPPTAPSPVVSEPPTLLSPPALTVPAPSSIPASQKLDAETCASCSLLVPESAKDPKKNCTPSQQQSQSQAQDASEQQRQQQQHCTTTYPQRDSSPIFRSTEIVSSCDNEYHDKAHDHHRDIHRKRSGDRHSRKYSNSSFQSNTSDFSVFSASSATASSCHRHALSYISFRGPSDPEESRSLRQASVRTLSCELLPKGITSGPLTFGDAESGYTIAYIFRIPDPMARGKRRSYALMALAGKDSQRAFRACPLIWRVFERIANQIIRDAEKEANRLREKQNPGRAETANGNNSMKNAFGKNAQGTGAGTGAGDMRPSEPAKITAATARNFDKPVTSFLTGRARTQTFHSANAGPPPASAYRRANLHSTTSPYGGDFARNAAGQIRARNLAEITGNTYIFAEMHAQFVLLLKELRRVFPSARPQRSHSGFFHQNSIASFLPSSEELADEAATAANQERRASHVTPCQERPATGLALSHVDAGAGAGAGAGPGHGKCGDRDRDRIDTSPASSFSEGNSSPASATTSATTASHRHDQGFPSNKRHSREHMSVSHHNHSHHQSQQQQQQEQPEQQQHRNTHKRPSVDDGAPTRQGTPASANKPEKRQLQDDGQRRLSVTTSVPGLTTTKAIPISSMRRNVAT